MDFLKDWIFRSICMAQNVPLQKISDFFGINKEEREETAVH